MKSIFFRILAAFVLIASPANAQWDFEYSYPDVFSAVADDYVVSSANIKTTAETNNKYMNPIANGVPAQITYRFPLNGTITEAYLFAYIEVAPVLRPELLGIKLWRRDV